jgi:Family of unknown function (DUF6221)
MDDLVAFLRARLAEDEAVARAATEGPWTVDNTDYAEAIYGADQVAIIAGGRWGGEASVFEQTEDAIHIARHDPARALREVEAKRGLLRRYGQLLENGRAHPDDLASSGALLALHGAVKLLALPYGDHPDYREEWRP